MKKLWDDERLQADLVKRGLERVLDFSWDRMAKTTLELYTKASYEKN
jgi:glycosyltransferase involved in cell wall biosynthesis